MRKQLPVAAVTWRDSGSESPPVSSMAAGRFLEARSLLREGGARRVKEMLKLKEERGAYSFSSAVAPRSLSHSVLTRSSFFGPYAYNTDAHG